MRSPTLEQFFPGLRNMLYEVTSPPSEDYNCIAYAAEDTNNNWWPMRGHYWPRGMPLEDTVDVFTKTFCEILKYEVCENGDLEEGYVKIAIYAVGNNTKHMARQLPDGSWTSKLGQERDITHTLSGVEGNAYGQVVRFLRRRISDHNGSGIVSPPKLGETAT